MKKVFLSTLVLLCCANLFGQRECGSERNLAELYMEQNRDACERCEDKKILKVIIDEPAVIRKTKITMYPYLYLFEITTHYEELNGRTLLIPCENISEEFRIEGLSVRITGNINSCFLRPISTEHRVGVFHNFVELISIKK